MKSNFLLITGLLITAFFINTNVNAQFWEEDLIDLGYSQWWRTAANDDFSLLGRQSMVDREHTLAGVENNGGGVVNNMGFSEWWRRAANDDFSLLGRQSMVDREHTLAGVENTGGGVVNNMGFSEWWRRAANDDFSLLGRQSMVDREHTLAGVENTGGGVINNLGFSEWWRTVGNDAFNLSTRQAMVDSEHSVAGIEENTGATVNDLGYGQLFRGVEDVDNTTPAIKDLSIFPNPAVDQVQVQFLGDFGEVLEDNNTMVRVLDTQGRVVWAGTSTTIQVADWTTGFYIVQVISEDNMVSKKLMVK